MKEEITLYELNMTLCGAVTEAFPDRYKVAAEISECRENASGHCYMELVQKNPSGETIAKARANIWASVYRNLRPYFEQATGERLRAGIKVLVTVTVSFHPVYHYALNVSDIDPSYTIGDIARKRAEIIKRLTDEGIIDDNKMLEWSTLPRRIAVISSKTAAGYGDFIGQLHGNQEGYKFYPVLFSATMQGEQSEKSVISAMNRIYNNIDMFDCVVIIRGGGASSELNCFDSYTLAQNVAQFPIPVVVGIGHDRDETVLDYVANTRVKTPTAAAEHLISCFKRAEGLYLTLLSDVNDIVANTVSKEKSRVSLICERIPSAIKQKLSTEDNRLLQIKGKISYGVQREIGNAALKLSNMSLVLRNTIKNDIEGAKTKLQLLANRIELSSPEHIMRRGYTITLKDGYPIKSVTEISAGDNLTVMFADGDTEATVNRVKKDIK